jgi:molybdate transport system ATP-binding protein
VILEVEADVARRGGFRLQVSFRTEAESLAIVGPSGSGKSTLLDVVAGIEPGRVALDGRDLTGLPLHRRNVGYVMQDAPLFPHLSVRENLAYGPRARRVEPIAEALGIAHLLDRMPRNLSGGERRRAALARAIASEPALLLLDEPFAGLDEAARREAMSLVARLRARVGIPMVLVSHVPSEVVGLADRAVRLAGGRVVGDGPATSLLREGETVVDNYFVARVVAPGRVRARDVELHVTLPAGARGDVRLACYAHDVLLARERPRAISARNVFAARVRGIEPAAGAALVALDDPPLRALVNADAIRELGIAPGAEVVVIAKRTAIVCLGAA